MQQSPVAAWKELSALYEQAETLEGGALAAWLDSPSIAGHAQADALRRMLQARDRVRTEGFLELLPRLHEPAAQVDGDAVKAQTRVGPYRLVRALGAGGMAEVWLAERGDGAFSRRVAIKLLFRHVGGTARGALAERFARERDILASLDHPHIAALHDAGITPDGQPWLAIEYVQGRPITAWCDARQLDVAARIGLFRQVLMAVQHAHANLVLHRDLKPANVLVTDGGEVRLLDFGIAKLLDPASAAQADTELTRAGGRPMTPLYASPEQLRGEPLTIACDVYALGVVLYELLCGERPYDVPAASQARLEQAILDTDPQAPSRRALKEPAATRRATTVPGLRRVLAGDLDAIVLHALAKAPSHRYASADAMLADLDRWLAGEPVAAHAPGAWYRLGKFVQRHRTGVALGGAAAWVLAGAAAIAVMQAHQAQRESARAVAARDFLVEMLKNADAAKSRGADVTARELLDSGRQEIARRLAGQPELQAELLASIAGIQYEMGEYVTADQTHAELARLLESRGDLQALSRARAAHAETVFQLGDMARTMELIGQARDLSLRLVGNADQDARLDWLEAWVMSRRGEIERSRALFERSRAYAEQAFGPRHLRTIEALQGLSMLAVQRRDFDLALAMQDDIASRAAGLHDLRPREKVQIHSTHVYMLSQAGRYRDAIEQAREASTQCRSVLGPGDEDCRQLAIQVTIHALRLGRPADARDQLPILASAANEQHSPEMQVRASQWLCRLRAALDGGATDASLVERLARIGGGGLPGIGAELRLSALLALADASLRVRQPQQAQRWAERVLADAELTQAGVATRAWALHLRGVAQLHQGQHAAALATLVESAGLYDEALGPDHPLVLTYSLNRALALEALGRPDEARDLVARARPVLRAALGDDAPTFLALLEIQRRLDVATARTGHAGAVPPPAISALFI
jgi:serine/threonine protein kinase/tetratricopeptide (TPR) repeat protein